MKSARAISRRLKVGRLSPLAITAVLAATSLLTTSGANASPPTATSVEHVQTVPTHAIRAAATVTRKGQVAPAVPVIAAGATRTPSVTIGGIPAVALAAYQHAAQLIDSTDPTCHMPWELIAGIGRVESDHGQFGGNHLTATGVAVPGIYGPVLDGSNGVGLVRDTDGGRLDHDPTYDRAVGPMQFLPGTWAMVGTTPTADGQRGPQNIYDAALATATYLCSGHRNMSNPADLHAAVFSYNHSDAYVSLVVGIAQAYGAGQYSSIDVASYEQPAAIASHHPVKRRGRTPTRTKPPAPHSGSPRPSGSATPVPVASAPPASTSGSNPVTGLLSAVLGSPASATPPGPSTSPMSATQAAAFCASHLTGYIDLFGTLHAECKAKLTGMTPAQAATGWSAHQNALAAWFTQ